MRRSGSDVKLAILLPLLAGGAGLVDPLDDLEGQANAAGPGCRRRRTCRARRVRCGWFRFWVQSASCFPIRFQIQIL